MRRLRQSALLGLVCVSLLFSQTAVFRARRGIIERIWEFLKRPVSTITYTLGDGSTDAQGVAVIDLSVSTNRLQAAGLQWELSYTLADVTSLSVTEGPVLTAASKTVTCNPISANVLRCLATGLNTNTIANGVAAHVTVQTQTNSQAQSSTIVLGGLVSVNRFAFQLASVAAPGGGVVTFSVLLSDLSCSVKEIEPGEQVACTVSLNRNAVVDTVVNIVYDDAQLTGPATVTIPAGQKTAPVTVTGH